MARRPQAAGAAELVAIIAGVAGGDEGPPHQPKDR